MINQNPRFKRNQQNKSRFKSKTNEFITQSQVRQLYHNKFNVTQNKSVFTSIKQKDHQSYNKDSIQQAKLATTKILQRTQFTKQQKKLIERLISIISFHYKKQMNLSFKQIYLDVNQSSFQANSRIIDYDNNCAGLKMLKAFENLYRQKLIIPAFFYIKLRCQISKLSHKQRDKVITVNEQISKSQGNINLNKNSINKQLMYYFLQFNDKREKVNAVFKILKNKYKNNLKFAIKMIYQQSFLSNVLKKKNSNNFHVNIHQNFLTERSDYQQKLSLTNNTYQQFQKIKIQDHQLQQNEDNSNKNIISKNQQNQILKRLDVCERLLKKIIKKSDSTHEKKKISKYYLKQNEKINSQRIFESQNTTNYFEQKNQQIKSIDSRIKKIRMIKEQNKKQTQNYCHKFNKKPSLQFRLNNSEINNCYKNHQLYPQHQEPISQLNRSMQQFQKYNRYQLKYQQYLGDQVFTSPQVWKYVMGIKQRQLARERYHFGNGYQFQSQHQLIKRQSQKFYKFSPKTNQSICKKNTQQNYCGHYNNVCCRCRYSN